MLGCVTAYYTANAIDSRSLYSHALARKSVDGQPRDFAAMPVSELMRTEAITVRTDSPFSAVARAFIANNIKYLYVLDAKGAFRGAVSLQDTKPFLNDPQLADVVIAIDIMRDSFPMLYPDSTITETIEAFGRHDGERLPVVTRGEHVLVGCVAKADVMIAFAHRTVPSPATV
jgi:CIC family chloride channel protein